MGDEGKHRQFVQRRLTLHEVDALVKLREITVGCAHMDGLPHAIREMEVAARGMS